MNRSGLLQGLWILRYAIWEDTVNKLNTQIMKSSNQPIVSQRNGWFFYQRKENTMLFMTTPEERAYERMMQQVPRYRWDTSNADYYISTYARYLQRTNTPAAENALTIAAESTP